MSKTLELADIDKILDANRWVTPDGHFMDPATGNVLGKHEPYEWLLADRRMMIGRDYLGEIAGRTTVTALYGVHDVGSDLPDNIEQVIGSHNALGVEIYGWSRADNLRRVGGIAAFSSDKRAQIQQRSWTGRQMIAAYDAGIPSFSFDVERDGSTLDKFVMYYLRQYEEAQKRDALTPEHQKLYLAVNDLRECSWPLKLGYELSLLEHRLPSSGDLLVMTSMGYAHRYASQRMGVHGLTVNDMNVASNWRRNVGARAFFRCMMTRRVTDMDLAEGAAG